MKSIYRTAIEIQNASNPSGVILALANEVLPAIREEEGYKTEGTKYLQYHPVVLLFMYKLADMAGIAYLSEDSLESYARAEATCLRQAEIAELAEALANA